MNTFDRNLRATLLLIVLLLGIVVLQPLFSTRRESIGRFRRV